MKADLPVLVDAFEIQTEAFPRHQALHPFGWACLNPLAGNRERLLLFLVFQGLKLLLLFDKLAILLDLFFHAKDLNIDGRKLSPETFIFEDLLIDLSHDLLLPLQALLIGQKHFEEGAEGSCILGVDLHAECIEAIFSSLEARPQLVVVNF
jgi:hypothetical protein